MVLAQMTDQESFGTLIRNARDRAELKQESLAQLVGCAPSYITKLEKGRSVPSLDLAMKLERALRLKPNELINRVIALKLPPGSRQVVRDVTIPYDYSKDLPLEAVVPKGFDRVPILGSAPAGKKSFAHDEVEQWVPLPREITKGHRTYLLRVNGDSMIPRINPGDFIIVDADAQPENGQTVVIRIDGEPAIKRFSHYGETIVLESTNPKYPRQEYPAAKHEIQLRGVVRGTLWEGSLK